MTLLLHIRTSFADAFFPRVSEWTAAAVLFATGWMLALNPSLMANGPGRGYVLLQTIADQSTWSTVLIVFGVARLMILLVNGAWRRSPHWRGISAFLAILFWTQIALSFAPTLGFAFIFACGWLGTDMINVMRAMRDARTVDDAYARGAGNGSK